MIRYLEHTLGNTVASMKDMIETHWKDVCSQSQQFADFLQAFDFVKNLPYVEDANAPECNFTPECVKAPLRTIERGGDCDDKAVLLGAFAKCFGLPYRVVTASYYRNPFSQTHTYLEVQIKGVWFPMDATYPQNQPYVEHPFVSKVNWES